MITIRSTIGHDPVAEQGVGVAQHRHAGRRRRARGPAGRRRRPARRPRGSPAASRSGARRSWWRPTTTTLGVSMPALRQRAHATATSRGGTGRPGRSWPPTTAPRPARTPSAAGSDHQDQRADQRGEHQAAAGRAPGAAPGARPARSRRRSPPSGPRRRAGRRPRRRGPRGSGAPSGPSAWVRPSTARRCTAMKTMSQARTIRATVAPDRRLRAGARREGRNGPRRSERDRVQVRAGRTLQSGLRGGGRGRDVEPGRRCCGRRRRGHCAA